MSLIFFTLKLEIIGSVEILSWMFNFSDSINHGRCAVHHPRIVCTRSAGMAIRIYMAPKKRGQHNQCQVLKFFAVHPNHHILKLILDSAKAASRCWVPDILNGHHPPNLKGALSDFWPVMLNLFRRNISWSSFGFHWCAISSPNKSGT